MDGKKIFEEANSRRRSKNQTSKLSPKGTSSIERRKAYLEKQSTRNKKSEHQLSSSTPLTKELFNQLTKMEFSHKELKLHQPSPKLEALPMSKVLAPSIN